MTSDIVAASIHVAQAAAPDLLDGPDPDPSIAITTLQKKIGHREQVVYFIRLCHIS